MAKELKNLQMEIFIKVNMLKENRTDMENIIGPMVAITKVRLEKDLDKVMECGKKDLEIVINMKVSILVIRSMATVFLLGLVETFTKETIMKIFEVIMDKCIGVMEVITRESGLMVFRMGKG